VSTESSSEPLALIAGSTQMPCVVAREALAMGRDVVGVAIEGVTEREIDSIVDTVHWLDWGDVSGFLALLAKLSADGVRQAVMAGKVEQRRIYDGEGDKEGMQQLLASVPVRHTDALIQAVVNLMAGAGIELLESTDFLASHLVAAGTLTARAPDQRERDDIAHGWSIAKTLGGLDIGQAVVVKDRAVVAIEAMEGTDECIRRAAGLAGPGTVLVKVAKPEQDLRFDLPVVGASTVATMAKAGATTLCVEAGTTVIVDAERCIAEADEAGIAIVGRRED
jgi:DUF1009 family protein